MVNFDGLAALVAAGFSGVATVISALNRRTNRTVERRIEAVHGEVATSNGHTLGELVEQNLAPSKDGSAATRPPIVGTTEPPPPPATSTALP